MYRIQPLAGPASVYPGEGSVIPFGINAAGDVAGSSSAWLWHSSSPEPVLALMGTLWQGAALSFTQPWNPSNSSILYALNAAGDAVGVRAIENTSTAHGEFVRGGIAYDLSSAVGAGSFVRGINDAGLACGWSMARPDAFVYDTHTGAVVSWIAPLPGTSKARAYGINHLGRVVGVSDAIAFVADGGAARGLGPASFIGGINDAGIGVRLDRQTDAAKLRAGHLRRQRCRTDLRGDPGAARFSRSPRHGDQQPRRSRGVLLARRVHQYRAVGVRLSTMVAPAPISTR